MEELREQVTSISTIRRSHDSEVDSSVATDDGLEVRSAARLQDLGTNDSNIDFELLGNVQEHQVKFWRFKGDEVMERKSLLN